MTHALRPSVQERLFTAADVDFTDGTPVISCAQKFVVPVPSFPEGGEPLVYPEDHECAGQPILGWDKSPVGETGIVFWNGKDSCWQAAADDGTHVIIINLVSERDASMLLQRFTGLGGPHRITLAGFKDFLSQAKELGLTDAYQSDTDYVKAHLTPVLDHALQLGYAGVTMGFVKRDDRDISSAVYVEDPFEFVNTDGVTQEMPNGGVIVRLDESIHAVQPDIFQQTYLLAIGGKAIGDLTTDIESTALTEA